MEQIQDRPLNDKVIFITGAAVGIGAAISKRLAALGAKIGMTDKKYDELLTTEELIRKNGATTMALHCDVTNKQEVFEVVEKIEKELGKIDVLINNAGIANLASLSECYVDKWLEVVDVNVCGPLHCIAAVLPTMMSTSTGHIINISSAAGRHGVPYGTVYSASKHFLQGLGAGMRTELGSMGIKVTNIQPSFTKTAILRNIVDPEACGFIEAMTKVAMKMSILEPEDVADSVAHVLTKPDRVGVNEILLEPKIFPS